MIIDTIKKHNSQYYNEEDRKLWERREILTIDGISVPQYIYNGMIDPLDHSTSVFKHVMQDKETYKGKKFLDIGTGAGINNILLTKEGFNVTGLDNNIYSLNCALYVMDMNNVYYKVVLGDHNDIEKMDYDVLIVNQMDHLPRFINELLPIIDRERMRGRYTIMTSLVRKT